MFVRNTLLTPCPGYRTSKKMFTSPFPSCALGECHLEHGSPEIPMLPEFRPAIIEEVDGLGIVIHFGADVRKGNFAGRARRRQEDNAAQPQPGRRCRTRNSDRISSVSSTKKPLNREARTQLRVLPKNLQFDPRSLASPEQPTPQGEVA